MPRPKSRKVARQRPQSPAVLQRLMCRKLVLKTPLLKREREPTTFVTPVVNRTIHMKKFGNGDHAHDFSFLRFHGGRFFGPLFFNRNRRLLDTRFRGLNKTSCLVAPKLLLYSPGHTSAPRSSVVIIPPRHLVSARRVFRQAEELHPHLR